MILEINDLCGMIDNDFAELIHTLIVIIKFSVPILLIIFGMLDLGKGVMAKKEDEIKAGQNLFIKRLIAAVLVFLSVTIIQFAIGLVDDKSAGDDSDVWRCANAILNGKNKVN